MWDKILAFAGPIVQLLNSIFGLFKKSATQEAEKASDKVKDAYEKAKSKADDRMLHDTK